MSYLRLLGAGGFVFFGCFTWDSLIDETFRRKPSDWLGYAYLSTIAMSLGYASKYLDRVISHPYRSAVIGFLVVGFVGWLTVRLWRKAAKWDKATENRGRIAYRK